MPLEPRAAVAEWEDGKLTVWTGTQRPFGVRSELATRFRMPEEQGARDRAGHRVRVRRQAHRRRGGRGRAAGEGGGKPVKLIWTREEEITWAYFRPGGRDRGRQRRSRPDGTITAWEFHNYNSGRLGAAIAVRDREEAEQHHPSKSPLRQGSYRGLAATANHFARESLHGRAGARRRSMDPLEFRLKNPKDERLRNVLVAAAEKFGWRPARRRRGAASASRRGFEKGGYVATCAEVAVDQGGAVQDRCAR